MSTDFASSDLTSIHAVTNESPKENDPLEPLSKRHRLAELTKSSIAKVGEFGTSSAVTPGAPQDPEVRSKVDHDAAFTTRFLHDEIRSNEKRKKKQRKAVASKGLNSFGKDIIQPKQMIKRQAKKLTAGKLSALERSVISQEADRELVDAHDEMENASRLASSNASASDVPPQNAPVDQCRNRLDELQEQRESLRAAWITHHQVFRVSVVPTAPYKAPEMPSLSRNVGQLSWTREVLQFIGRGLLFYLQDSCTVYVDEDVEPQLKIDTLQKHVERLILASAVWQSWLYDIGTIYRWENPRRTAKWLLIFLVLWYTEHVVGFVYGYILYIVIMNRYTPKSIRSVRESIKRAADSQRRATRFVELIDKHGAQDWIDTVIEEMGPSLQLLAVDIGNYVEILLNFYEWRAPARTCATLSFFVACLAVTCVADMAFCVKIVWFVAGGTFFFLWPIASLYPQYRALVSPVRWVFWGIPTHAEWAFQYLRRHAQEHRERLIKQRLDRDAADPASISSGLTFVAQDDLDTSGSSNDSDHESSRSSKPNIHYGQEDVRVFRAIQGLVPGRLVISTNDLRFVRTPTGSEEWRLPYVQLSMMWKSDWNLLSKLKSSRGQLIVRDIAGNTRKLEGLRHRDDAFNNIIAFSGLRWQNLEPK